MRKITIAAVLLLGLAGTAYAQQRQKEDPYAAEDAAKARDAAALDKKYKTILELTDQSSGPVKVDPWQNMRGGGTDAAKPKR
jgi:hypothetical protein